jgi:hypothetical protein
MATLQDLQTRLDQNDARYTVLFAGQPRVTRDLGTLDDLIATAQHLRGEMASLPAGPARDAIQQAADRQLELLRGERTAIVVAGKEGGELARRASLLGTRANFVFHRYARHFAGQSRSSRDPSLLLDMIAELDAIAAEMKEAADQQPLPALISDLEVVARRRLQFDDERKAIATARADGTHEEQSGAMADAANHLFAQYRTHFAGQTRVTRRPELLVRLIGALEEVRERMTALKIQGLQQDSNEGNLGIVTSRLQAWQQELTAIRAERQKATIASMVADLGMAANAEFEAYGQHFAGQSRKTRDLKRLSDIIDRVDEIERQMTRLDQFQSHPDNRKNLQTVRDALTTYQNEFEEIEKARQESVA